ncbi:hypothetical protein AOL_s00076g357 [Orbilia oligospora ATCC 24927]|uniref:Major facilitator superfamily (MFS) profile domain-containing protein n=1 Tax=Arthrobotrys oligospora (strain ATCC 24927 / CBS 115.81 / DSM 1491) TaxID=756982 RepID=G1X9Q0_ARTOA|nr:hypothetical protein AOL_s00076g357 [Orbilia oligospora ATCC 24927]EGX50152.1 hypothetical protein AOL_s00076g357 [Orbilia oligospora ATCC 24927]
MAEPTKAPPAAAQVDEKGDISVQHYDNVDISNKALNEGAKQATAAEHNLTFLQAIKTYRRAAIWSVLISTTVIMEGYDVTLLGSFFGYPEFQKKYGYLTEKDGYQISANWMSNLNVIAAVGNIIGALLNGYLTAKFGHRIVLIASLALLTGFIFIVFFAQSIEIMFVGTLFCNIPWGVFATSGPAYAAEVAPLALRGYLTAYVNLCWCIGQFISAGVLKGLVDVPNKWSYKVPFAIQWVWPIPLAIFAYMAPESPWFLVRVGKLDEAKKSLMRLSQPEHDIDYDAHIALMVHTNKLEKEERKGVNYYDAFRGTNRRRTEIACMAFLPQITNGGALCYSGSFFFQQTGINASTSYGIALGGTGIAFVGTIISWFYLSRWGRRTIWFTGFSFLVVILFLIGVLASVPNQTKALAWGQSLLTVVWLGAYSMSVGPIVYTIVAEIGSTRLRTQTVVLARSTYYVGNIICGGLIQPRLLSPTFWDAKGKTAWFWFVLAFFTNVWGYYRLPETKDRTFEELDILFQKGVPAREFASYQIDRDEEFSQH